MLVACLGACRAEVPRRSPVVAQIAASVDSSVASQLAIGFVACDSSEEDGPEGPMAATCKIRRPWILLSCPAFSAMSRRG